MTINPTTILFGVGGHKSFIRFNQATILITFIFILFWT